MNDQNTEQSITLLYHNFRGMAQNIRYILFYLNIPFNEILLKPGQQPASLQIIKNLNFCGQFQLPCLVDGNHIIQDCFAIIRYICAKAKRQDLLGSNIEQRTLIRQIYYNFLLKKKKTINLLFKFGQEAANNPSIKEQIRKKAMLFFYRESGSLIQLLTLKLKRPTQRYIFNHITILDFLLYEESFYQINLFGNLAQKNCKLFETINCIFGTQLMRQMDKQSIYLYAMRRFKQFFEKQKFYQCNKERLQSYSVLSPSMGNTTKQGFRTVWLGPQHYVI